MRESFPSSLFLYILVKHYIRIMTKIIRKYYNYKTGKEVNVYPWTSTEIRIKVQGKDWVELFEGSS